MPVSRTSLYIHASVYVPYQEASEAGTELVLSE